MRRYDFSRSTIGLREFPFISAMIKLHLHGESPVEVGSHARFDDLDDNGISKNHSSLDEDKE